MEAAASPARREALLHRHDGDSPIISMKRLMQQLMEELEGLRQQQSILLQQLADQGREEDEHREWVKQRLDTLEHTVQEAAAAASASAASASAAAASASSAATAATTAAAAAAAAASPRSPSISATGMAAVQPLVRMPSFEFTRLACSSLNGGGSPGGSPPGDLGAPAVQHEPVGGGSSSSPAAAVAAPAASTSSNGAPPAAAVGGSCGPVRGRFRQPSPPSSDDGRGDVGGGGEGGAAFQAAGGVGDP
ncbi:hypothetical protein Agub_g14392, partial [Astrephomene gubernaculifera]